MFTQGRNFTGQRPDETDALCRCSSNHVITPSVRHATHDCVCLIHYYSIAFRAYPHQHFLTPDTLPDAELCVPEPNSADAAAWVMQYTGSIVFTCLQESEVRNAIRLEAARKGISDSQLRAALAVSGPMSNREPCSDLPSIGRAHGNWRSGVSLLSASSESPATVWVRAHCI